MSYAKLFSAITESRIWDEPYAVRLLFVSLLAQADENGLVDVHDSALARLANIMPDAVQPALTALLEQGYMTAAPVGYVIVGYKDFTSRSAVLDRRDWMKSYMRDYRARTTKPRKRAKSPKAVTKSAKNPTESAKTPTKAAKPVTNSPNDRYDEQIAALEANMRQILRDFTSVRDGKRHWNPKTDVEQRAYMALKQKRAELKHPEMEVKG